MKLLITKQEYQANSELHAITSNHEKVNINSVAFVNCTITDTDSWGKVSQSLDSDNYATGIFLPKSSFKKK